MAATRDALDGLQPGGDSVDEYVAECRREWRRLGVSSPIADRWLRSSRQTSTRRRRWTRSSELTRRTQCLARHWALERGVVPTPVEVSAPALPLL